MSGSNHIADIAILGGGPGGYVAAIVAAQLGARVVLVEKDRLGGTCLNVGCIPTKALLTSADLLLRARHASDFGLNIPSAEPDLAGLMAYKRRTVDPLVGGVEQLDGRVAAENATGSQRQVDYRSVPSVIFTCPELASVGSTETQARADGVEVKIVQSPFSANPRARTLGEPGGLVKLICETGTGRVLGVHMLGPHVTDLIAEGALAVQTGTTADELAWTTHAHPTLPEATLEAALGFRGGAIHFHVR